MSKQNISDIIANNTSLTASLAKVIAEKAAMEKRMGQQISRLRNETGNKRKSTEMDDADSPHVGILRQMVDDKEKELTYVRDQNANAAVLNIALKNENTELRTNAIKKDDELIKALAAKDKMKSDADKHILENAGIWKAKNDKLKTGNLELKAKYESLREDKIELAKRYNKLKAEYEKRDAGLKNHKRMKGLSSSFGSFINFKAFSFLSKYFFKLPWKCICSSSEARICERRSR